MSPRLEKLLSQYKKRDGKPLMEKVDDIKDSDFIINIVSTISYTTRELIKPILDNYGYDKSILVINNIFKIYMINKKPYEHSENPNNIYGCMNIVDEIYSDIFLSKNIYINSFINSVYKINPNFKNMTFDNEITFEKTIHDYISDKHLKVLYRFLGLIAICLIAFGLYRLYRKYKKQS